jgi:MFS family permease
MLKIFEKFYLTVKLSPGITSLYSNIIIDQIGSGLVGLFLPIFLWEKLGSLQHVLLYYLAVHVIYVIVVVFGAKIMSHIGQKASMILAVPFKVLFFGGLYYLSLGYPVMIFIALMLFAVEMRMMLFWVPYHTDFAEFTNKKDRGRIIGYLSAISSLVSIFIPIIAGWVIFNHGYDVLFLMAMLLVGVSVIPLFLVRPTYEKFSLSFIQTWQEIFSRKNRRMILSYSADGIENVVSTLIWPIFIFQLLNGDFLKVGAISSLIVLAAVAMKLVMGAYTDRFDKRKLLRFGSSLYAVGWIVKMFVGSSFHIFVVSTYHNFAAVAMRTPLRALIYEKAADSGHYVDELTVLREIAFNLGKAVGIVLLLLLVNMVGLQWTFVLGAIASLFVNLI